MMAARRSPSTETDAARRPSEQRLVVRQYRSAIGAKPKHRGTLRALGLGRVGQGASLPDRPEIRGMLARVPHLVEVVEEAE
jgi:large subunit ribosomal protein L30